MLSIDKLHADLSDRERQSDQKTATEQNVAFYESWVTQKLFDLPGLMEESVTFEEPGGRRVPRIRLETMLPYRDFREKGFTRQKRCARENIRTRYISSESQLGQF